MYRNRQHQNTRTPENNKNKVISIQEKPENPKSNYAVPGLYIYNNQVINIAKKIKPSNRNELEITDVNLEYLKLDKLKIKLFEKESECIKIILFFNS